MMWIENKMRIFLMLQSIKWQIFIIVDDLECSCTEFWDFIYKNKIQMHRCKNGIFAAWQTCKSHKLMLRTPSSLEWNREQQQAALGLTFRILTISALTHLHSWVISSRGRSVTRGQIYATLHAARQVMRRQGLSVIFGGRRILALRCWNLSGWTAEVRARGQMEYMNI